MAGRPRRPVFVELELSEDRQQLTITLRSVVPEEYVNAQTPVIIETTFLGGPLNLQIPITYNSDNNSFCAYLQVDAAPRPSLIFEIRYGLFPVQDPQQLDRHVFTYNEATKTRSNTHSFCDAELLVEFLAGDEASAANHPLADNDTVEAVGPLGDDYFLAADHIWAANYPLEATYPSADNYPCAANDPLAADDPSEANDEKGLKKGQTKPLVHFTSIIIVRPNRALYSLSVYRTPSFNDENSDYTILCESGAIGVHRQLLRISGFFRRYFEQNPHRTLVILDKIAYDTLLELLRFMYGFQMYPSTVSSPLLRRAAEMYEVNGLREICERITRNYMPRQESPESLPTREADKESKFTCVAKKIKFNLKQAQEFFEPIFQDSVRHIRGIVYSDDRSGADSTGISSPTAQTNSPPDASLPSSSTSTAISTVHSNADSELMQRERCHPVVDSRKEFDSNRSSGSSSASSSSGASGPSGVSCLSNPSLRDNKAGIATACNIPFYPQESMAFSADQSSANKDGNTLPDNDNEGNYPNPRPLSHQDSADEEAQSPGNVLSIPDDSPPPGSPSHQGSIDEGARSLDNIDSIPEDYPLNLPSRPTGGDIQGKNQKSKFLIRQGSLDGIPPLPAETSSNLHLQLSLRKVLERFSPGLRLHTPFQSEDAPSVERDSGHSSSPRSGSPPLVRENRNPSHIREYPVRVPPRNLQYINAAWDFSSSSTSSDDNQLPKKKVTFGGITVLEEAISPEAAQELLDAEHDEDGEVSSYIKWMQGPVNMQNNQARLQPSTSRNPSEQSSNRGNQAHVQPSTSVSLSVGRVGQNVPSKASTNGDERNVDKIEEERNKNVRGRYNYPQQRPNVQTNVTQPDATPTDNPMPVLSRHTVGTTSSSQSTAGADNTMPLLLSGSVGTVLSNISSSESEDTSSSSDSSTGSRNVQQTSDELEDEVD